MDVGWEQACADVRVGTGVDVGWEQLCADVRVGTGVDVGWEQLCAVDVRVGTAMCCRVGTAMCCGCEGGNRRVLWMWSGNRCAL